MQRAHRALAGLCVIALGLACAACDREERRFREVPPGAAISTARVSELQPGLARPAPEVTSPYVENAYAIAEGQRLYPWFNCSGCRAHGGGAIGPPLMDDTWIYGSDPAHIFDTIVEGRPNGMPSFADKIPNYQVWQITAYVRSLSGLVPKDAAPGRSDAMHVKTPESAKEEERPKSKKAEHPE